MPPFRQGTNIILTGFMGTGKTTVGRLLAGRLGYKFVDTDALIQARHGRPIPDIFRELGETSFRQMEAETARELAGQAGLVIATGGGFMLNPANLTALSRHGLIFCLVATPEEILARVSRDKSPVDRPLLRVADPARRIVELLQARAAVYQQFRQISTSHQTPAQVAGQILALLEADSR
jgi:shikimate kinase